MQGAYGETMPTKSDVMWTASGFTDSIPVSAVNITATTVSQHYDRTAYVPRVPYFRYILTNTGDSLWTKIYYLCNEDK
jgi:hypothetical protein